MAGSMKDALSKAGVTPPEPPKPPPPKSKHKQPWNDALPEDESLPPLFEAPALTKPMDSSDTLPKPAPTTPKEQPLVSPRQRKK